MIVTKEPLELANEVLIVNMCTHYVLNRNIVLCPTDLMYATYEFKFTLSKNTINTSTWLVFEPAIMCAPVQCAGAVGKLHYKLHHHMKFVNLV